jgi:prevent-host-death family protein
MNTLFISRPSVQAVRFSDKPFFVTVTAQIMKTVAITTVKDQLSAYVQEAQTSPVIITKNGKPVALLTGIRNEDDLDSLLLANNPRFLQILEEARQRVKQTGGVKDKDFWKAVERCRKATSAWESSEKPPRR